MGGSASKPATTEQRPTSVRPGQPEKPNNQASGRNAEEESKLPTSKSDKSYGYDWKGFLKVASRPAVPKETLEQSKQVIEERSPVPECPVKHQSESNTMDQSNNVHVNPNQLPTPTQTRALSTEREISTIPKDETDNSQTFWVYPSPQMFYNALSRKGKLNNTTIEDVASVVNVHNTMNEATWVKIQQWEKDAGDTHPKLLKFEGRPHDLSPKATFKHYLLGHPLPFNRHDWMIERPDGTVVRYVLDYYYDENGHEPILTDVRPALDKPSNLLQRLHMQYSIWRKQTEFEKLPLAPSEALKSQVNESMLVWDQIQGKSQPSLIQEPLSESEISKLKHQMKQAEQNCQGVKKALENCKGDDQCQKASLDWILCHGKYVCPLQHSAVQAQLDGGNFDTAMERLHECVNLKSVQYSDLQK